VPLKKSTPSKKNVSSKVVRRCYHVPRSSRLARLG
jgi:hypothetical protein